MGGGMTLGEAGRVFCWRTAQAGMIGQLGDGRCSVHARNETSTCFAHAEVRGKRIGERKDEK